MATKRGGSWKARQNISKIQMKWTNIDFSMAFSKFTNCPFFTAILYWLQIQPLIRLPPFDACFLFLLKFPYHPSHSCKQSWRSQGLGIMDSHFLCFGAWLLHMCVCVHSFMHAWCVVCVCGGDGVCGGGDGGVFVCVCVCVCLGGLISCFRYYSLEGQSRSYLRTERIQLYRYYLSSHIYSQSLIHHQYISN